MTQEIIETECRFKDRCSQRHCAEGNLCLIRHKLTYLFTQSCLPENRWHKQALNYEADGTDKEEFLRVKHIEEEVIDFVNLGQNLYLYSKQAGNGKTSWATRILQSYLVKNWRTTDYKCRALFISVPSFLLAMKANITAPNAYYQHIIDNVRECDLVVWDDIGNKVGTEYEISNLLSIIDERLNKGKSNIYTSNIPPEALGTLLDIRLASRIAEASYCIEFKGGDKRHFTLA